MRSASAVLTEHAFASGRLLAQNPVESRTAFTAAFDEVIRARHDGELGALLMAWLTSSDVRAMEELLYRARSIRCDWAVSYEPTRLSAAALAFAASDLAEARALVMRSIKNAGRAKAVAARSISCTARAPDASRTKSRSGCSPRSTVS